DSTYPASRECLALKVFCRPSGKEQKMILDVLKYHLGVNDCNPPWHGAKFLGKKYLFAAVAVVNLIRKLEQFVREEAQTMQKAAAEKRREEFLKRAKELFGSACLDATPVAKENLKQHPLLRFFHCVEIPSDDRW